MDRRDLLRLLGTAAAATGLSADRLLALQRPGARRHPRQGFFTAAQRETVTAIADAIIPATDTPGAVEAGVADYIEMIVSEWYETEDRTLFMRGLAHLDEHALTVTGARFPQAEAGQRRAMLLGLEAEGRALLEADPDAPTPFFHRVRGLVLHGYYTSEIGMTRELLWKVIPGRFDGCADLADVVRPTLERGR